MTIFSTRVYCKKKFHNLSQKNKSHDFTKNKKCMHVANLPSCGPLLILCPALKHWGPLDVKGDEATRPTCGPLLILSPALKRWGPQAAAVMYPPGPIVGPYGLCPHL